MTMRTITLAAEQAEVSHLTILADNKSVKDGLDEFLHGKLLLPKQCFAIWSEIAHAAHLQSNWHTYWVPAHGGHLDWRCPPQHSGQEDHWRTLNEHADTTATTHVKAALRKLRDDTLRHQRACRWAAELLDLLVTASRDYTDAVEQRPYVPDYQHGRGKN